MSEEGSAARRALVRRARTVGVFLIVLAIPVSIALKSGLALFVLQGAGLVAWMGTVVYANRTYGPPEWARRGGKEG